ncbi:hypothetical protein [Microbacterium maritypicum]|uniref:hypothetical protein n=1 Tax=Microbacterium maritypicum TaxID=33918 RepID=UPI00041CC4BC|nr:hypothetical protein [Microbacterium liquefaciens]
MSEYALYTPTTNTVRRAASDFQPPITPEEFDRWLAAHDAEVRASVVPEIGMPCANTKPHPAHAWQMSATGWCLCAGVVAEEPEWEYGIHSEISGNVNSVGAPWMDRAFAEKVTANDSGNYGVRRRKAGPWVPVKQEGPAAKHEIRRQP